MPSTSSATRRSLARGPAIAGSRRGRHDCGRAHERSEQIGHAGPVLGPLDLGPEVGVDHHALQPGGTGGGDHLGQLVDRERPEVGHLDRRLDEQVPVDLQGRPVRRAHGLEPLAELEVLVERARGGVPDVEALGRAAEPRLRAHARHQRRPGLLHRLGAHVGLRDGEEPAGERDRVRSPAGLQRVDELVTAGAAGAGVDVHLPVLVVRPADAEAHDQPSLRQQVEGGQPLGEVDRAVVAGHEDAGADGGHGRPRRGRGQRLERADDAPVALRDGQARPGRVAGRRLVGEEQVLLHPQPREAQLLGPLAEALHHMAAHRAPELREAQTDSHGRVPVTGTYCSQATVERPRGGGRRSRDVEDASRGVDQPRPSTNVRRIG